MCRWLYVAVCWEHWTLSVEQREWNDTQRTRQSEAGREIERERNWLRRIIKLPHSMLLFFRNECVFCSPESITELEAIAASRLCVKHEWSTELALLFRSFFFVRFISRNSVKLLTCSCIVEWEVRASIMKRIQTLSSTLHKYFHRQTHTQTHSNICIRITLTVISRIRCAPIFALSVPLSIHPIFHCILLFDAILMKFWLPQNSQDANDSNACIAYAFHWINLSFRYCFVRWMMLGRR